MTDAVIHLRVPAGMKGRWIIASRAAGLRLGDWIINAVEAYVDKQLARIAIPADLEFSALQLGRNADGDVSFDVGVIERICEASGVDPRLFIEAPEGNVAALIVHWYAAHRANGGAPDPVAEDLIGETRVEDARGGGISHAPGRA